MKNVTLTQIRKSVEAAGGFGGASGSVCIGSGGARGFGGGGAGGFGGGGGGCGGGAVGFGGGAGGTYKNLVITLNGNDAYEVNGNVYTKQQLVDAYHAGDL